MVDPFTDIMASVESTDTQLIKCQAVTSVKHPITCLVLYCCMQYMHSKRVWVSSRMPTKAKLALSDILISKIVTGFSHFSEPWKKIKLHCTNYGIVMARLKMTFPLTLLIYHILCYEDLIINKHGILFHPYPYDHDPPRQNQPYCAGPQSEIWTKIVD